MLVPHTGPGIVLTYTCTFVAQPPGTRGYAHNFRLLAPVLTFEQALHEGTATSAELETIKGLGRASGYLYLPLPVENGYEDALALLYRPSLVHQNVLDHCERPARLSEPAQRILVSLLVKQFSPTLPALSMWDGERALDRSDGWLPQPAADA